MDLAVIRVEEDLDGVRLLMKEGIDVQRFAHEAFAKAVERHRTLQGAGETDTIAREFGHPGADMTTLIRQDRDWGH